MEKLYLGINGHLVCLDKHSGETLWATKLRTSNTVTNVLLDGDSVFAYATGHMFCLSATNGEIRWENTLKGMGYGPCIIACESQSTAAVAGHGALQQSSAAVATALGSGGSAGDGGGE